MAATSATQDLVISLLYEMLGEVRFRKLPHARTMEEYKSIAQRLPKIAALHAFVNQRLGELAQSGKQPFDLICDIKPGDKYPCYRPFPKTIAMETVRKAFIASDLPPLRKRRAITH